jgi:hypothetical protein
MTTSSISSASSISQAYPAQPVTPKPVDKKPASTQDSVHLSDAAKAAGDVDHDGDSK